MKSAKTETVTPLPAEIIDRGCGPEIKGTRITVYDILDYFLDAWHPEQIATWFRLSSDQVQAAIDYIRANKIEVLKNYVIILERCARGNPPELQAKLDRSRGKAQELMEEIREARARSDAEIQELVDRRRAAWAKENGAARDHGGQ